MTGNTTVRPGELADTALSTPFEDAVATVRQGGDVRTAARGLYDELTDAERFWLLDGDLPFWEGMRSFIADGYNVFPYVMGEVERLGIPGIRFVDGPRGVVVGRSTAFPVSMARGATWDVELEERVGEAIGRELREQGGNFFGGVCVNLPRHPAWGRAQETYSDQPLLLGELGAALTRGVQRNAMACVKHFALNSMENARFSVDVTVDEATLHEVYLPHFARVVRAGVAAVMSSYNSINGEWAGQNPSTLTTVLRDDWGFEGIVVSDFIWGLRDAARSLAAGLDIEAPFHQQRAAWLRAGGLTQTRPGDDVERACIRILSTQLRHYASRDDQDPAGSVAHPSHVALAREVAQRAAVLLKNEAPEGDARPVLPFAAASIDRVAVLGRLAAVANTGDHGSSDVRAPYVVTPLQGLREALPDATVGHSSGTDLTEARELAAAADVAVVVVGYTAADEGEFVDGSLAQRDEMLRLYPEPVDEAERRDARFVADAMGSGISVVGGGNAGGDRRDLHLSASDVELIRATAAANPRTVVVIVNAGAVLIEEWHENVPGILIGWYSGMEGGRALADLLLGTHDPSGRLPYPIPASADDLPPFDIDATAIDYDRWYGQRLLQHRGVEALFPLGYGLSYSRFELHGLELTALERERRSGIAQVAVRNSGSRAGRHVVQVYGVRGDGERRGERELLGFASVAIPAGESVTAVISLDLQGLAHWDPLRRDLVVAPGSLAIEASSHWGDAAAVVVEVEL